MNLTRFALHQRTTITAAVVLFFAAGLMTFQGMSRREDPEITIRQVPVLTYWPGATAKKIEELITDPLEKQITQISEVKKITSESRSGTSMITVELEDWVPAEGVDQLWDQVRTKVMEAQGSLPAGSTTPFVNEGFTDVFSVCLAMFQATPTDCDPSRAHAYSYRELERFAEQVEDEVKRIRSVAKVMIVGAPPEVVEVTLNPADWSKIGLTEGDLAKAVNERNIIASGGIVDTGAVRFPIRPTGEFDAVDQLRNVMVGRRDGLFPVSFDDLPFNRRSRANGEIAVSGTPIQRTHRTPIEEKVRFMDVDNGPCRSVMVAISMKDGYNVVDMGSDVAAAVRRMKETSLPADLEIEVVNDLPRQVDGLVSGFVENLMQAILIVLAVSFLMMGWRPAVIMALAIPLAMISSLSIVSLFDVDLEQFSIASMIIALGMLVDNAIVVSDNCSRLIQDGVPRLEACERGATGLATPILTSTLTTVAAFLPMLTLEGSKGEYVASLPIVVSTTLLTSYVVAMLITPVMCYWILPKSGSGEIVTPMERLGRLFRRKKAEASERRPLYDRTMLWCLRHKALVLGATGGAFLASTLLLPLIGSQFFPMGERDQFFVHIWLPEGSSIDATDAVAAQVEQHVLATRESTVDGEAVDRLANTFTFVGSGGPRFFLTASPEKRKANYAYMIVNCTDAKLSADWVTELQPLADSIPGARVTVERFMLGPQIKYPVEVLLSGPDDGVLRAKGQELMQLMRETPGLLNPGSDWGTSSYEVEVDIDPYAANLAGVTNEDVARTVDGLITGTTLTTYREGDHQIPVVLRMQRERREQIVSLQGISVNGTAGKVPLGSIATLRPSFQPSIIARENQIRTITVGAKLSPGSLANDISIAMEPNVRKVLADLPPAYRWRYEGELGETKASQAEILDAFGISFLLILLILISQYNSLLKPIIVLCAVPMSFIGAFIGLYLTGWPLGFMPMLGLVSLAGVVINNAIILIDFIKQGVREGKELHDAVAEAGRLRMKPIVLTTLTTIGGMLPLALFGGPMWAGMAWAVMAGLALSTALTLLVVPTAYTLAVERLKVKP